MLVFNKILKQFLTLLILCVFCFTSFIGTVSALPPGQKNIYDKGIHYFDNETCSIDTTTTDTTAPNPPTTDPSANKNIFLIGDSILVGSFYLTDPLKQALIANGWDPFADASGGRGMTFGGGDTANNRPGARKPPLEAINTPEDTAAIAAAGRIVIELGTNGITGQTKADFKTQANKLIDAILAKNSNLQASDIYWVNIFSTSSVITWQDATNAALQEIATDRGIHVIDTVNKGIDLQPDNIHPNPPSGTNKFSQIVSDGVGAPGNTPGVITSPTANSCACAVAGSGPSIGSSASFDEVKKFIFSYLVSKGLEPFQAAGIMGNMQDESGFNPQRLQSTPLKQKTPAGSLSPAQLTNNGLGWGLVQFTPPGKFIKGTPLSGDPNDPKTQLDFILDQLDGKTSSAEGAAGVKFKATTDARSAASSFELDYERHDGGAQPHRGDNAVAILAELGSSATASVTSAPTTTDVCTGATNSTTSTTGPLSIKKLSTPLPGPGGEITPKGITLHWWGSQAGNGIDPLVAALRSNPTCGIGGCSVQFGITSDGEVYQLTPKPTSLAYHATGANSTTFGIEIEGAPEDFGQAGLDKYPKKLEAVIALVQYLKDTYHLEIAKNIDCGNVSGIVQHLDMNKCPGASQKSDIDDVYFKAVIDKIH
jgi:hypothetical protein